MFFTFLTPINMNTCAGLVSHNVNKCRLGILCSALRYVAVLKITEKIHFQHFNIFEFFQRFYLINFDRKFLKVLNAITIARLHSREISA